eukprot:2228107-Pyramimonas_sp.AAC.2
METRHMSPPSLIACHGRPARYDRITGVPRPNPPHMHQPVQACERVMRTVYLPTTNVESLLLKCESLQAQLNEQVPRPQQPA